LRPAHAQAVDLPAGSLPLHRCNRVEQAVARPRASSPILSTRCGISLGPFRRWSRWSFALLTASQPGRRRPTGHAAPRRWSSRSGAAGRRRRSLIAVVSARSAAVDTSTTAARRSTSPSRRRPARAYFVSSRRRWRRGVACGARSSARWPTAGRAVALARCPLPRVLPSARRCDARTTVTAPPRQSQPAATAAARCPPAIRVGYVSVGLVSPRSTFYELGALTPSAPAAILCAARWPVPRAAPSGRADHPRSTPACSELGRAP